MSTTGRKPQRVLSSWYFSSAEAWGSTVFPQGSRRRTSLVQYLTQRINAFFTQKSSGRSSDALLLKGTLVEEAERTVWLEGKEAELRAGTTAEVIEWLIVNPSDGSTIIGLTERRNWPYVTTAHRFFDTFLLVSSKFIPAHEVLFRLREK